MREVRLAQLPRGTVTDPAAVDALRDALGSVGILVNSAGVVGPSRPLVDVGLDEWRATFRVNVDA